MKASDVATSVLTLLLSGKTLLAGAVGGDVIGWGNSMGSTVLGFLTPESSAGVVEIRGKKLNDASSVAAGMSHVLVLRSDGTVVGLGFDRYGQATPPNYLRGVKAIAAGQMFSVTLKTNGTVVAWGENAQGQTNVPPNATEVVAISAGMCHTLALRRDGTVVRWGRQTASMPHLTNIVAIAAGGANFERNLALKGDGAVVAWGGNYSEPPPGLTNVVAIAVGEHHSLALKRDGTVVGWGLNGSGEATGVPTRERPWVNPGELVTLNGQVLTDVTAIAAGNEYGMVGSGCRYSLALRKDGTVVAWGLLAGRPVSVPSGLTNVTAMAAGWNFCLAITTNSSVTE